MYKSLVSCFLVHSVDYSIMISSQVVNILTIAVDLHGISEQVWLWTLLVNCIKQD